MRLENSFNFLPGVGEKTEQQLWTAGVTHWDGFDTADDILGGRYDRAAETLETARRNLDAGNTVFFGHQLPSQSLWRLYRNVAAETVFLDIETTGLDKRSHRVTTVSLYEDGDTTTFVRGEDLDAARLQRRLDAAGLLVTFNGKRFDMPFLRHSLDIDTDTPHLDLMYPCRRLGLTGGLKAIEEAVGIDRDIDDVDGADAVRLWRQYERHGDEAALDRLVHYNQLDVINLEALLDHVHGRLREEVFTPHVPE